MALFEAMLNTADDLFYTIIIITLEEYGWLLTDMHNDGGLLD